MSAEESPHRPSGTDRTAGDREVVSPVWQAMVATVTDHVRRNLDGDLSLAALAKTANISTFHFHRLFTAVAGETPAAFVRRARLDRAAKLMAAEPHRRLTDIAFDVGFSSPSELSRSYKRAHGDRPSALEPGRRRWGGGSGAGVPPAVDRSADLDIGALPARRLAVVRAKGVIGLDDLTADYEPLAAWATAHVGVDWHLIAMSWDDHETTPLDRVHIELGAVVDDMTPIDPPFVERRIPATSAVWVRSSGDLVHVADAWDHLYRTWFPSSRRRPANLPGMMSFRERPERSDWRRWELDCVIALTQRTR